MRLDVDCALPGGFVTSLRSPGTGKERREGGWDGEEVNRH